MAGERQALRQALHRTEPICALHQFAGVQSGTYVCLLKLNEVAARSQICARHRKSKGAASQRPLAGYNFVRDKNASPGAL